MRLSQRFNFLVTPLVALPLLALGWITYNQLDDESRRGSFSDIDKVLSQLTQRLDRAVRSARATSDLLAADLTMQQYAMVADESDRYSIYQRGLLSRFRVYLDSDPRYNEIRFILPDGYEDARRGRAGIFNAADEESESWWFGRLSTSSSEHFQFIGPDADTGKTVLYVFKPLLLADVAAEGVGAKPLLRGFIGVTLNLDWLQRMMTVFGVESELTLALLSPRGELLLANDGADLGEETGLLEHFRKRSSDWRGDGVEDRLLGDSRYYIDAEHAIDNYGFVSAVPAARIHQSARELTLGVVIITLASILFSIVILTAFMRRVVVSPLRELIDASNTIGSGKLGTHIDVKGDGELSELAQSFNRMARDLARSDEKIRFIAHHDTLTRLPNRHSSQLFLDKCIANARRTEREMALLFLDIDNFKTINDTMGHDKGDELLVLFAEKINACLREGDFFGCPDAPGDDLLARHGGDEFTIVLPDIKDVWSAAVVAQRIIESLADDIVLDGHRLRISTSIGITIFPRDGDTMEELLKCADIAMYHAKDQGRNNYQFYTSDMMEKIIDRIEGEKELKLALEQGDMRLYYQPQLVGKTDDVHGFEALVRWQHAERGLISPMQFIDLAEETGLIVELGSWVIQEACRQAARWLAAGLPDFCISVNVSSVQFQKEDIAALISATLGATGLPGRNLTVELTESVLMSADGRTWEQLRSLRALGVSVALDDFGTGYSSLSYLRSFPVDILKIDRSFISEIEKKPEVQAIVTAIVDMAAALDLKVVAEGVEDEIQAVLLKAIGCEVIQGYFYSPPVPADKALEFFRSNCITSARRPLSSHGY